jgi:uncharacterized membrane protein SpoIIM required for sporulation
VPIIFLVLNGLIIGLVIFEVIKAKGILFTLAFILNQYSYWIKNRV